MRNATIERNTKETKIRIGLDIDGTGDYDIVTPIGFFSHMIESFSKHGLFDIRMTVAGDTNVDQHHTVEDCGIALGQAFGQALAERRGINRAGYFVFPMDEALAIAAVDIGGRAYLQYDLRLKRRYCGGLDCDLIEDFFQGFAAGLGANIAIKAQNGRSDHHKIEAVFKAFARAMKMACQVEDRIKDKIPSTKGVIRSDGDGVIENNRAGTK